MKKLLKKLLDWPVIFIGVVCMFMCCATLLVTYENQLLGYNPNAMKEFEQRRLVRYKIWKAKNNNPDVSYSEWVSYCDQY